MYKKVKGPKKFAHERGGDTHNIIVGDVDDDNDDELRVCYYLSLASMVVCCGTRFGLLVCIVIGLLLDRNLTGPSGPECTSMYITGCPCRKQGIARD